MQYGLTEEQEMIASTVRTFVEKEIYPHEDHVDRTGEVQHEVAEEIKRKTIDLGFYACNFPESVGCAGLNHALPRCWMPRARCRCGCAPMGLPNC